MGRSTRDRALFDRIAASYARKDLFPASATARRMRLEQTFKFMKLDGKPDILELGCGAGFAARYLHGLYQSYTGIDYSEELIRYARIENALPGAAFHVADIQEYDPGCKFDAVFMVGVLHHMADLPLALGRAKSLTRPSGTVAVNEPQPSNPLIHALRRVRAKFDANYSSEQVELTAEQLITLFAECGLVDVAAAPQGYFSTPFAEVIIRPGVLINPLSRLACTVDGVLEQSRFGPLSRWAWNVIVTGRCPTQSDHS